MKTGRQKQALGSLLLLLTAMIWGTAFVAQRTGMEAIEPITFNAARMALAAAAVGPVAILARRRAIARGTPVPPLRRTLLGGVCCGAFLAAASVFQQMGLVYTEAGKAGFITAMYMLLVPVIQFVVFRRRQSALTWAAVLTGVIGLYLLCVNGAFALTRGDALVCVCALLFSGHILCCDRFTRGGDSLGLAATQFATAAILSAAVATVTETPRWEQIVSAAVPILYCGLVSGGVGYTLQMVAQRFTDPTVASLLMSLEAVFAAIAGALLLGERMSGRELLGCGLMLAAIIAVQFQNTGAKPTDAPSISMNDARQNRRGE